MKKIVLLFMLGFSFSCFALEYCNKAPDITDPTFCSEFSKIAICHCMADGRLPPELCPSAQEVYKRMIATFGSQDKACRWQEKNGSPERTTYQECMDDWNCYMKGGVDSKGRLCSGTGAACV